MNEGNKNIEYDILIQGAGIGGLTLAIALFREGYKVKVIERAKALSEIGAGIWMAPNCMQVFKAFGFSHLIKAAGWDIKQIILQDFKGDILQKSNISQAAQALGFETTAIHRVVLQSILFHQLPADTVSFAQEVSQFNQTADGVKVKLTDGSHLQCKILMGADGINSSIRNFLNLNSSKRYSGSSSYRAIASVTPSMKESLNDSFEIWGIGCRLGCSRISDSQYYWYLTFDSPPNIISEESANYNHAQSIFEKYFSQWLFLLKNTKAEDIIKTDISDLKRLSSWSVGRVGLIGDAAHATTPNLGQGAAMAIEDAYFLALVFKKFGLTETALKKFNQLRKSKVNYIVSTSWWIGKMSHFQNVFLRQLRNSVIKATPEYLSKKQWEKIYNIKVQI